MRKLVHLLQKARYFDMYSHVIIHRQNEKEKGDRAFFCSSYSSPCDHSLFPNWFVSLSLLLLILPMNYVWHGYLL